MTMTTTAGAPAERVGAGMLLATACGTAIATVSALGLFQIERLVGGVWSVAAVVAGAVLCRGVARAFARLCAVVPSGAGLVAYLARGLGRRAGIALALPYLLLTLLLVGVEALVVGTMLARLLPVDPLVAAAGLVIGTWLVARAGVRFGYRTEAASTTVLVVGMVVLSVAVVARYAAVPGSAARFLPPPPDAARFAAAVGQALFLFMGFELVTTQVEVARAPSAVARALSASVPVLAAFYGVVSLGFSALPTGAARDPLVPQLEVARAAGGTPAAALCAALCLLAAFTSLNGALLALSRFIYALASQGVLPRSLAALHGRRLVPRRALAALAAIAIASTTLVAASGLAMPLILAAAAAAALAYAAAVLVRERAPFAEPGRPLARAAASLALALVLGGVGAAVVAGAGPARAATAAVLGGAAALAAAAAWRAGRRRQVVRVRVREYGQRAAEVERAS
jgi:amino acid transporter